MKETPVASLTVRGLDQETKARLRIRAARHGRSMEAEVRSILREALAAQELPQDTGLGSRIHTRFAAIGGLELDLPPRTGEPRAAAFE
jgi:plasmid stability protein